MKMFVLYVAMFKQFSQNKRFEYVAMFKQIFPKHMFSFRYVATF